MKSNTRYTNPLDVNPGNAGTLTPNLASVAVKRVDHTVEGTATDGESLARPQGKMSAEQADPQVIVPGHVVPLAEDPAE